MRVKSLLLSLIFVLLSSALHAELKPLLDGNTLDGWEGDPAIWRVENGEIVAGHVGLETCGAYVASKHAVEGLTKAAALEVARHGIRVNAVAPGAIQTDMIDRAVGVGDTDARRAIEGMHPLGRMGTPEEVAAAILFLASDAASFITGQSLAVDGGWLAR